MKSWFDFINARDLAEGPLGTEERTGGPSLPARFRSWTSSRAQEKEFTVALPAVTPEPGVEYWLNLSFVLKNDAAWAKKGHEIAWEQFRLPWETPAPQSGFSKDSAAHYLQCGQPGKVLRAGFCHHLRQAVRD